MNENTGNNQSSDTYSNQSDTSVREITEVVVTNTSDITDYTQVVIGLQCVLIGLLLALIVAKVWGKL